MKKWLVLFILLISNSTILLAQEINAYKTFGGVRFEMDTISLSLNQVLDLVKENPAAYEELKRAKTKYNVAGVLGFTGAILIVVPVATAIAGGNPEWALAGGGAALILASIPFNRSFRGHTLQALDIYNAKFKSARVTPGFQFYGTGARLILRF